VLLLVLLLLLSWVMLVVVRTWLVMTLALVDIGVGRSVIRPEWDKVWRIAAVCNSIHRGTSAVVAAAV